MIMICDGGGAVVVRFVNPFFDGSSFLPCILYSIDSDGWCAMVGEIIGPWWMSRLHKLETKSEALLKFNLHLTRLGHGQNFCLWFPPVWVRRRVISYKETASHTGGGGADWLVCLVFSDMCRRVKVNIWIIVLFPSLLHLVLDKMDLGDKFRWFQLISRGNLSIRIIVSWPFHNSAPATARLLRDAEVMRAIGTLQFN